FLLSGVIVLAVSIGLGVVRRFWPAGLAAWVYYAVILLPSLGVITYGPQLVGDRYSYFSCLSWALLAGAGVFHFWKRRAAGEMSAQVFLLVNGLAGVLLMGLGVLTWKQTQIWHNSEELWRYALALDQRSSFAHNNLGLVLAKRGALEEAINEFRKATQIDPASVEAYTNLGNFLAQTGAPEEAIVHLRHALQINPADPDIHNNLGLLLARRGSTDEAAQQFAEAARVNPGYAKAYFNLGKVFAQQDRLDDAVQNFRRALRIQPEVAEIHEN